MPLRRQPSLRRKADTVVETIRDDGATSVGTGGSTTDDGEDDGLVEKQAHGANMYLRQKTTRPPYIDTKWWKSMQWVDRKKIAKQYVC